MVRATERTRLPLMQFPKDEPEQAAERQSRGKKNSRFWQANQGDEHNAKRNNKSDRMTRKAPRSIFSERNDILRMQFVGAMHGRSNECVRVFAESSHAVLLTGYYTPWVTKRRISILFRAALVIAGGKSPRHGRNFSLNLLRGGRRLSRTKEFLQAQELALQSSGIDRPQFIAGFSGQRCADGGEFGVEIVHVMKDERFPNHLQLCRNEFVLAVMTDQKMLHDGFQRWRKALDFVYRVRDGFDFHDDVAKQLPFAGVPDGAFVAKLVELSDVVQNGGRQE